MWIDVVAILVGLLGGGAGIAALWNARTTAKKGDIDDLRSIIASLRDENVRLQTRVNVLEKAAAISRTDISGMRDIIDTLRIENERLRAMIVALESAVKTLREENTALRNDNTKMRNRLRELENGTSNRKEKR